MSTSLDAKVLVDGNIKSANTDSSLKGFKLILSSVNQLGKVLNSQNSLLVKTVGFTDDLKTTSIELLDETGSKQKEIEDNNNKLLKIETKRSERNRNLSRKFLDKSSEDKLESKKIEKEKSNLGSEVVKKIKSPFEQLMGFFGNLLNLFIKYVVINSVLKWMSDPKNTENLGKLASGLGKIFKFLWDITSAIGGLIASGVANLGAGIFDTANGLAKGDVGQVFNGLGQLVQSIPGLLTLRWVMNPASLVTDVMGILNTIGGGGETPTPDVEEKKDKKPEAEKPKPTQKRNFFQKTSDKLKSTFERTKSSIGKFASEKTSGLLQQGKKLGASASERVSSIAKNLDAGYKRTVGALQDKIDDLAKRGRDASIDWLSKQGGVLGNLGKKLPDLMKRFGKYLPFVGDAVGFFLDIASGVDWRRALIRAVTGAGIDAGFTGLMGLLGVAAPFTGGASGVLAAAIYGAYMAADASAGGFGRRLGDLISDKLGLPMNAGENAKSPANPGSQKDVDKLQKDLQKKSQQDPEFSKKIKDNGGFERGGIVGPNGKMDPNQIGSLLVDSTLKTLPFLGEGGLFAKSLIGPEASKLQTVFGESRTLISQDRIVAPKKPSEDLLNGLFGNGSDNNIKDLIGEKTPPIVEGKTNNESTVVGFLASIVGVMAALVNKNFNLGSGGSISSDSDGNGGSIDASGIEAATGSIVDKGVSIAKKFISNLGITKEAAAAIAGNFAHESSGFIPGIREGGPFGRNSKPWPKGTVGRGYGWAQWTNSRPGDRYDKFIESYGGDYNKIPTNEDNFKFAVQEMRTTNKLSDGFKKMTDVADATVWFRKNWERAGVHHDEPRIKYAKGIVAKLSFGGKVPPPGVGDRRLMSSERSNMIQSIVIPKDVDTSRYANLKGEAAGGLVGFANGGKFENGKLPSDMLETVSSPHKLAKNAAEAYRKARVAAKKEGVNLDSGLVDAYRDFAGQQYMYKTKPAGFAARPGTSKHGLGIAIDVSQSVQPWWHKNGSKFGWINPAWAKSNPYEPWHFEFGSAPSGTGGTTPSDPSSSPESKPEVPWYQQLAQSLTSVKTAWSDENTKMNPLAGISDNTPKKSSGGEVKVNNEDPISKLQTKYNKFKSEKKYEDATKVGLHIWALKYKNQKDKSGKPTQMSVKSQEILNSLDSDYAYKLKTSDIKTNVNLAFTANTNLISTQSYLVSDEEESKNRLLIINNNRDTIREIFAQPQVIYATSSPSSVQKSFFN